MIKNEEMQPELKDILEMLNRYTAANKDGVCLVYNLIGFKKDEEHKCTDCGGDCESINDTASRLGAYGDIHTLRAMINELRDMIEDTHEDGFVNV